MKRTVILLFVAALLVACGTPAPAARIAFTSWRDGVANSEIYVMNADGYGLTRLTDDPAVDSSAAWSPDGKRIVFSSTRDGGGLFVMNADGSGQTRLTDYPAGSGQPAWSPNGKRIAFVLTDGYGNSEIHVMNAAPLEGGTRGTNAVNLTDNPAADYGPAWSPDGTRIAFMSDRDGNVEIYVMNAAPLEGGTRGSNAVNLTKNWANDSRPAWSPNGQRIAFASDRWGNSEIYVMNADGSNAMNLTDNAADDFQPAWSPDGTRIAFTSDRDGNWEIYVMNADGSGQTNLTDNPAMDHAPAWSP